MNSLIEWIGPLSTEHLVISIQTTNVLLTILIVFQILKPKHRSRK
jgi:hypothetical protein